MNKYLVTVFATMSGSIVKTLNIEADMFTASKAGDVWIFYKNNNIVASFPMGCTIIEKK